jgi:hypothetical protein
MSSAEITDSPQVRLMHSLVEGFRNKDMDYVAKLLHKDHRRITYPRSIGKPEQTKEEYLQHTREVVGLWVGCDASRPNSKVFPPAKLPPSLPSIPS